MSWKIQFRRDTAANWTSNNPTLAAGEIGIETDTRKIKIGDGSTSWTSLNYIAVDAAAHKDNHDPEDGSDPLDTANAAEISGVVAAGTGTSHSLARADHVHAINHGITDNHIVTIDQADAASGEYAKFTANGLESKSFSEVKADLDLEIGTDVLAQQTIGIADNNLVEIDGADIADDEYARFTANGLESRTASEVYTDLLAQVLLENDAIKLDPSLSADGKYNGITEAGTAGATLAFGDVVYQAVADDRWELAQADATATSTMRLGICVLAAAGDASATNILLWGKVRADAVFPTFTKYAPVFISAATAGDLTNTAPSTATNVVRCVGHAISADELMFTPDNTWVVVA